MENQEPWRIDKESVHWRVLKGWLSDRFKEWLERRAIQLNISSDDLLVDIIETIRKISWRVFSILEQETNKEVSLPFTIILDDCFEIVGLKLAIFKNNDPDFFCDREKVRGELKMNYLPIWLHRLRYLMAELTGGLILYGTSCDLGIALYDKLIMNLIDNFSFKNQDLFLKTIAEESFHHFAQQTGTYNNSQMQAEIQQAIQNINNFDEREKVAHQIEIKYGVKTKRDELVKILKQDSDLFFPLLRRIQKDAQ